MPHSCPRPCGRLATAAVFVSVGVVQFIAGLILLKSKYVYLLSGPNFWTAASNFAVGVLLGMSASVWKDVQKITFKHVVRRNLLASLVASAMIINSTTAIILILGEGNALLSIQLENDGKYPPASEILAYSYATSVCSPIVSVVVAIVFLSGMWFRVNDKGIKTPEIKSILKKNSTNEYNWVFKERQSPKQDSTILKKELSFKTLSSSSDDESFSLTDAKLWSNSVKSIEYFNTSSRKFSHRFRTHRHSKIQQESACECGARVENLFETIPHETNRVSFADDTKKGKFLKFSPQVSRSLETDSPLYSDHIEAGNKNGSSLSYAEFKMMHRHFKNSKQRYKKRLLLTEHPAFQQSKSLDGKIIAENFHKLDSPEVYLPRFHTRIVGRPKSSTTSEVKTALHMDPESQDCVDTSESPIVYCGNDAPSCDALTPETVQHKKLQFQRSSTFKKMKNPDVSQPEDKDTADRKVCRTSTASGPSSSNVSHLNISDIQSDSVIDPNELYESEDEKSASALACPQPATSQMDSNIEIDDSFIDGPELNVLAGEVVKVQVNSLLRTPFHSKLVPVPIPIVSSVKKHPLRRKQKESVTQAKNRFSGRNELRLSSFHGDIRAINQSSQRIKTGESLMNQEYETIDDVTICEMFPDNVPPSPAQTSGYASAIFESGSECFKPNLSSSDAKSPYYTPKRKSPNFVSPRNLDDLNIAASE